MKMRIKLGKNKRKSYDHPPRKTQWSKKANKDFSIYEFVTCHKMAHIAINCPMKVERVNKKNKIFQAHVVEDNE